MSLDGLCLPERSDVVRLAQDVAAAGGRLVVVGGWVRDHLNGEPSNDLDLEIFGLTRDRISAILSSKDFSKPVGRQFPVWRATRLGVDVAYPRAGADSYSPESPDSLEVAFRAASLHRDLTINAIGWDPIADTLLDPWKGRGDLEARMLRSVSEETFGTDPMRVLRVARLRARYDARVDDDLEALCRRLDLSAIAVERLATELRRILCELRRPSRAFEFLDRLGQLDVFAPLAALRGVPQDPRWHPEGDVYVHTCMVVDRAAEIADGEKTNPLSPDQRETLLFAALCHDLGKAGTTTLEDDGRIRSLGHEALGAQRTRSWLEGLRLPERRVRAIETLVANHLAPSQLISQGAGAGAFRKLARRLATGGVGVVDLERLARADFLGRTTSEALAGRFDAGRAFLDAAEAAVLHASISKDVVSASMLMQRGVLPGPRLGRLLARCREIQDETGSRQSSTIIDRVLEEGLPD